MMELVNLIGGLVLLAMGLSIALIKVIMILSIIVLLAKVIIIPIFNIYR